MSPDLSFLFGLAEMEAWSREAGSFGLPDFLVMGRWTRDRAPLIVGIVLVSGALVWTVWASHQNSDALAFPGFVVALTGVLLAAFPLVVSLGRRPPARSVDVLAALLAEAVDGQWQQAAIERRLVTPEPIPLRWSLNELAVTGPVRGALGTPDGPPAFPPLPGMARTTETDLPAGGGRAELHHLYAGLASGRLVVVGPPGAGKTGTAILLLLDALRHYYSVEDTQRARVPVPVLLTAHGWDPNTRSVRDWLRDRLTATYPMFAHRNGRAEAADLVTARDKIALILDGFDEMDPALRPAALGALSDAPFRVVVFTRGQELSEAASRTWLTGALAVRLCDITAPQASDYLQRARSGPAPRGWAELLTHLSEHPDDGALARGLSTPLTLTLVRDTYQAGDDVRELLDPTRYGTVDALEHHLITRVLPAAYTPLPGRPAPRYPEQQAHQTLSFVAQQMGQGRDLTWWHVPRWAPAAPRILITGLVFGLVPGIGLASVVGVSFPTVLMSVLACSLGVNYGHRLGRGDGKPRRFRMAHWRAALSRKAFRRTLLTGLAAGYGVGSGLVFGQKVGLWVGVGAGAVYGLAVVLTSLLLGPGADTGLPTGPRQVWRNDRLSTLAEGLTVMLVCGLAYGFIGGRFGTASVLGYGLAYVLLGSHASQTTLAWLQLQLSHRVPAVRLIPFLEDARQRDILRTVGATYQFRHARLQDHLATTTTTVPRSSSVRSRS